MDSRLHELDLTEEDAGVACATSTDVREFPLGVFLCPCWDVKFGASFTCVGPTNRGRSHPITAHRSARRLGSPHPLSARGDETRHERLLLGRRRAIPGSRFVIRAGAPGTRRTARDARPARRRPGRSRTGRSPRAGHRARSPGKDTTRSSHRRPPGAIATRLRS